MHSKFHLKRFKGSRTFLKFSIDFKILTAASFFEKHKNYLA